MRYCISGDRIMIWADQNRIYKYESCDAYWSSLEGKITFVSLPSGTVEQMAEWVKTLRYLERTLANGKYPKSWVPVVWDERLEEYVEEIDPSDVYSVKRAEHKDKDIRGFLVNAKTPEIAVAKFKLHLLEHGVKDDPDCIATKVEKDAPDGFTTFGNLLI